MPFSLEYVNSILRFLLAYMLIVGLFCLNTVSLSFPVSGEFDLPFMLIAIYYWSVYRPTLIPAWMMFAAGLVFDLLSGLPVGLTAFIYIALRWIVVDQRLFLTGQNFLMVWFGFVVVSFMAMSFQWILFCGIALAWVPFLPSLAMFFIGVFLYPPVSLILHASHRMLPYAKDMYGAVRS